MLKTGIILICLAFLGLGLVFYFTDYQLLEMEVSFISRVLIIPMGLIIVQMLVGVLLIVSSLRKK